MSMTTMMRPWLIFVTYLLDNRMKKSCKYLKWKCAWSVKNAIHVSGLLTYILLVFLPAGALVAVSALSLLNDPEGYLGYLTPGERQVSLLMHSIGLSVSVAVTAMIIATLSATFLLQTNSTLISQLKWFFFVLAPVPPYIHALVWASCTNALGIPFFGWGASFWVYLMAYLPFAVLVSLLAIRSVDSDPIRAGRVYSRDIRVYFKIILPLARSTIMAGGTIIFLLVLMDYSVPSLFSVNVYPLDIFAEYSTSGDSSAAFLMSVPLILPAIILVLPAQKWIRTISGGFSFARKQEIINMQWPVWFSTICHLAGGFLFIHIIVLFSTLLMETGSLLQFSSSVTAASNEIWVTLIICLIFAFICIPPALAVSGELIRGTKVGDAWWFAVLLPLTIPAPLIGMGLIGLWNSQMPVTLHGNLSMPVLALLARFTPFAVILMFAFMKNQNMLLMDASEVFAGSYLRSLRRIILPLLLPGIIGTIAMAFALGLGELGATLMVMPAGDATLTMRIYNYLHYGASDIVAGLSLLMTIMTAIAGIVVFYIIERWTQR